jgi:ferredoxin
LSAGGLLYRATLPTVNGKRACVTAEEDTTGGTETFTFQICDQTKTVTKNFSPGQRQQVCMGRDACGKCRVVVTAVGSQQPSIDEWHDLDAAKDDGTGN